METVHGTTVSIDGAGVLLQGPSGSGKSDLALRLIDGGALLVADDRTALTRQGAALIVQAPAALRGMLEVRGLGLVRVPIRETAQVALAVDLETPPERLPAPESLTFAGISIPVLRLSAFESGTPAKIRLAVCIGPDDIVR